MLLDSVADPSELKNLSSDQGRAATVQQMKELLKQIPAK